MQNSPLQSAFAIAVPTVKINIVTPEFGARFPSPLRQVETDPSFLSPSFKMAEADGNSVPLDYSDQEWALLRNVAVPPPKVIPSPVEREPPDKQASKRSRKRSSRRSRRRASTIPHHMPPQPPFLSPQSPLPPSDIYKIVEPSNVAQPPSPSSVYSKVENNSILLLPPSPST